MQTIFEDNNPDKLKNDILKYLNYPEKKYKLIGNNLEGGSRPIADKFKNVDMIKNDVERKKENDTRLLLLKNIQNFNNEKNIDGKIYENFFPTKNLLLTNVTLHERITLFDYIRSIFFKYGDYFEINLNKYPNNNKINLYENLKAISISQLKNKFTNNPFNITSENLSIYKVAFPITYSSIIENTIANKNEVTMNLRMYLNFDKFINDYDFYHFMLNTVLKRTVSPNFTIMYGTYKYNDNNVILTEENKKNFIEWCSMLYDDNSPIIKKMIQIGQYDYIVWLSVIFQLLYIIYILQYYNIYVHDFSLEKNIYIRKINTNYSKYWIYKIDNIEYYVPNYGFIVVFDILENNIIFNDKNKKLNIYDIININIFSQNFLANNGFKLPDGIITLLYDMEKYKNENNAIFFIENYFHIYLHNRIGTYLREYETYYLYKIINKSFKKGDIVTYIDCSGFNIYALYYKKNNHNSSEIIIENGIRKLVSNSTINKNEYEAIEQLKKNNLSYIIENLLEIYST